MITQGQLRTILSIRADIGSMNEELASLTIKLREKESIVILALDAGEAIAKGSITAFMEATPGRCAPPWKEVHLAHMCDEHGLNVQVAEANVRADYPAKPGSKLTIGEVK